jgi:hypothetical protein
MNFAKCPFTHLNAPFSTSRSGGTANLTLRSHYIEIHLNLSFDSAEVFLDLFYGATFVALISLRLACYFRALFEASDVPMGVECCV